MSTNEVNVSMLYDSIVALHQEVYSLRAQIKELTAERVFNAKDGLVSVRGELRHIDEFDAPIDRALPKGLIK